MSRHPKYGPKLKRALEMRAQNMTSTRIAALLDVSPSWVRHRTSGVSHNVGVGQPRTFDYDKALEMLPRMGWSYVRVGRALRVPPSTIRNMVRRRRAQQETVL